MVTVLSQLQKHGDILRIGWNQKILKTRPTNLISVFITVHSSHGVVAFSEVRVLEKHLGLLVGGETERNRLFELVSPDRFRTIFDKGAVTVVAFLQRLQ